MTFKENRKTLGVAIFMAAISMLVAGACSDDSNSPTGMPKYIHEGKVVILMHDAPVDDLQEVWLTVNSIRFIGGGSSNTATVLDEPVRLNFLALDSVSQIMSVTSMDSQTFSKIRLEVSDPEFLDNDSNVIESSDIKLVANGKVDLNFQHPVTIDSVNLTVVSIDLDLDNSIQVNKTGKGKYILRPQFFVDAVFDNDSTVPPVQVEIPQATIISLDPVLGTLEVEIPGSPGTLVVHTDAATIFLDAGGLPILFTDLVPATGIRMEGYYDPVTGDFVAGEIQNLL